MSRRDRNPSVARPRRFLVAWAFLGLVVGSRCVPASSADSHARHRVEARSESVLPNTDRLTVVLLAIDGVRWQDVFLGVDPDLARRFGLGPHEVVPAGELTPNLHRIASGQGVLLGGPGDGGHVRATGPNYVSLPGYQEMLSGRPPRCRDNQCPGAKLPTIVDEFTSQRGCRLGDVAVVTSWPAIGRVAAMHRDRAVLSVGRSGGSHIEFLRHRSGTAHWVALGEQAGSAPGHGDFRPDRYTAGLGVEILASQPRFLFIGLGETDEYAHQGNYRGYLAALRAADRAVGLILSALDRFEAAGARTLLLVTTDHGRARLFRSHGHEFPESARVWFAAAGNTIRARHVGPLDHDLHLRDLAPTIRYVAGLPEPQTLGGRAITELFEPGREQPQLAAGAQ